MASPPTAAPSAVVDRVLSGDARLVLRGETTGLATSTRLRLLATGGTPGRTLRVDAGLTGNRFEVVIPARRLVDLTGRAPGAVSLRLEADTGTSGWQPLPMRADRSSGIGYPAERISIGRRSLVCRPQLTPDGGLGVRLARPAGAGLRRTAPAPVRLAAKAAFGLVERRRRSQRARRRAFAEPPHKVYFLLRSTYGIGGTVRTVTNAANYLADVGFSVEILSLLRPSKEPAFALDDRVTLTPWFDERSRRRSGLNPVPGVFTPLAKLAALVLDRWASVLVSPTENLAQRSSLLTDIVLVTRLGRLQPGVLVLTRPGLNVLGARFASAAVRTVGQEHNGLLSYMPELRDWMLAHYGELDALAVLTFGDEQDYTDRLAAGGTLVRRIPNGLPGLPARVSDQTEKVLIGAGRLTGPKGFHHLFQAFARVAKDNPEWQLRIFGEGQQRENLQRRIRRRGLADRVHLMGHTTTLLDEMARGSLFALASRSEGLPMVLIEAMSAGLPVVSFNCSRGTADLVAHDVDGLLVPNQDVPALAEALDALMQDDDRRRTMAAAARAKAETFTLDRIGDRWSGLLGELGVTPQR